MQPALDCDLEGMKNKISASLDALIFDRAQKIVYLDLIFLCEYLQWTIGYEKYVEDTKAYEKRVVTTL
jgi:hypothetical protein